MRFRFHGYIIIIFLTSFFIFIPTVSAAVIPVPFNEQPIYILLNLMLSFILTASVEFCIVYIFIRKQSLDKKKLFYSVGFVNLVLFPPINTLIFFTFTFYIKFFPLFTIILSFLMILLEWLLYRSEFQKLFYLDLIRDSISLKKTILISTLANIASFGLIYLVPVIVMIQQFILFPYVFSLSFLIT